MPVQPWVFSIGRSPVAATALILSATLCSAGTLTPAEALDRYLARERSDQTTCSTSVFAVQIDASLPALNRHGSMSGFKRIIQPGHAVYRGVRFTGDRLVKTQVIARFLAHETSPAEQSRDDSLTRLNYIFTFHGVSDYNGIAADVFLVKPRRKRTGVFQGELWLNAETAEPLRLWGDLVKSPSILVRSFRFVQDYQAVAGCTEPLRLLVTARTRIAGTAEIAVWLRPALDVNGAGDASEGPPSKPLGK